MKGLAHEGGRLLETDADDSVRDTGLIGTAQRTAHYATASYWAAFTHACLLGRETEHEDLPTALADAKVADEKLTQ